jgi:hypothetical protein
MKILKLDGVGSIAIPEGNDNSDAVVQISQAVSLKRIADALDKLVAEPANQHSSVFENIFGKGVFSRT